jgi:hypothetical protein
MTTGSSVSTNVVWTEAERERLRLPSPSECRVIAAQEDYAADRIDARELERRVGEALGVR